MQSFCRVIGSFILLFVCACVLPGATTAAKHLTFDDFISLGRVSDPQISPDGRRVAFVVTYYDKEQNKGNSDIYITPIDGGETRRLTQNPSSDASPRFSPDGKWIAFRSSRGGTSQIWILPTAGGEAHAVTTLSTGASNPQWSPDGRHIIFTSSVYPDCPDDECNKKRLEEKKKSKVSARVIDGLFYRHWDAWRDETRGHIFITTVDGDDVRDLTPGDIDYPTIALGSGHDIAVSPDGQELCVTANVNEHIERNINNDLFTIDIATGEKKQITENPANDNHPTYSPDGRYIAYRAMARAGFEADQYRLTLYDRASGETKDIGAALADDFDRSVRSISWVPNSKGLYITCGDAGYVSLYHVDAGNGRTAQITKKMYVSSLRIGPDARQFVFLKQSATAPYEVFAMNHRGVKIRQLSHVNDEALATIDMNALEAFSFPGAGDTEVHGFLLKPPNFDPNRQYPLVFLIHGGPQGAWSDNFHWRWNYQMFAAGDYVVAFVNPRGSTGYGQKFTDEISGDWGGKVYTDLMNGLDYVLDTYSFIDKENISAAGASFGGYMINWIEGHTDRFKCLVNHDGVYNFTSFYGTTEELWFPEWDMGGIPWENREAYAKYSPHMYAENFKTPMLVIHGGKDYRVDPSEGFQLFTTLQRQGVPSKLLYFPDEGHWVSKPQNAELWWTTVHEWLGEWLGEAEEIP